ncbi:MAG: hypothetical protein KDD78_21375 [Caldilineaceae bacterium]|nr:hypothetical protein [Caldilineaceae bacterium]
MSKGWTLILLVCFSLTGGLLSGCRPAPTTSTTAANTLPAALPELTMATQSAKEAIPQLIMLEREATVDGNLTVLAELWHPQASSSIY